MGIEPDYATYNQGLAYHKQGKLDEAIAAYHLEGVIDNETKLYKILDSTSDL